MQCTGYKFKTVLHMVHALYEANAANLYPQLSHCLYIFFPFQKCIIYPKPTKRENFHLYPFQNLACLQFRNCMPWIVKGGIKEISGHSILIRQDWICYFLVAVRLEVKSPNCYKKDHNLPIKCKISDCKWKISPLSLSFLNLKFFITHRYYQKISTATQIYLNELPNIFYLINYIKKQKC